MLFKHHLKGLLLSNFCSLPCWQNFDLLCFSVLQISLQLHNSFKAASICLFYRKYVSEHVAGGITFFTFCRLIPAKKNADGEATQLYLYTTCVDDTLSYDAAKDTCS